MSFFTYILYDKKRDKYYIGQTNNLQDRIFRHQNKRNKYTKVGYWNLVFFEKYLSRKEAIKREKQLKNWKSKKRIAQLVRASRL